MLVTARNRGQILASAAVAAGLWFAAMPTAQASVLFNNVGSEIDGSDPVGSFGPLAQSFSTGGGGFVLDDVQLLLGNDNPFSAGSVKIGLYADNGTTPGSLVMNIGTLADSAVSAAGFSVYDISLASSLTLAANTRYWIEVTSSALPSSVELAWSDDLTALGVAGQFVSNELGVSDTGSSGAYQLALISEPSTVALFAGSLFGLGLISRRKSI